MQIKNVLPIALGAAVASAQSLTEALAANNGTLGMLTSLIASQPGLLNTLGGLSNITILAPSNMALGMFLNSTAGMAAAGDSDLVTNLLRYHVLNGTYPSTAFTNMTAFAHTLLSDSMYANVTGGQVVGAQVNGSSVAIYSGLLQSSMVSRANLNFTGGIIHVIDTILTIPQPPSDTALAAGLTALVGALNATDLVETVDNLEDVTIFAPNNGAFSNIASALANISTEDAASVLQYHVVQGTVAYSSMISNTTLKTVGGGNITISVIDGEVFVNSAKVVIPDVLVSNGVVHVIDNVLNPMNATAVPEPDATSTVVAFVGGISATDGAVPFTSGVVATTTITNAPTNAGAPGAGASATSTSSGSGAKQTAAMGAIGMGALLGGGLMMAI